MREGQTGVIGLWDEVRVVTWTFSSHKAEALLLGVSQAVSFLRTPWLVNLLVVLLFLSFLALLLGMAVSLI